MLFFINKGGPGEKGRVLYQEVFNLEAVEKKRGGRERQRERGRKAREKRTFKISDIV